MKNIYVAPWLQIESFEEQDVVTLSLNNENDETFEDKDWF